MVVYKMIEFAKNKRISEYSPLALAYIGDSIYEVYVRSRIIAEHPDLPAHKLHVQSIKYVKAHAQSNSMEWLLGELNAEEEAVYKRGRNAKSPTVPKNAQLSDYRRATGFEALLGYLYMTGSTERLEYIMQAAYCHALDEVK